MSAAGRDPRGTKFPRFRFLTRGGGEGGEVQPGIPRRAKPRDGAGNLGAPTVVKRKCLFH